MYRFASRSYSVEEIKEIAFKHGQDGMRYYPPSCWGRLVGSKDLPYHPADKVYEEAYLAGQQTDLGQQIQNLRKCHYCRTGEGSACTCV